MTEPKEYKLRRSVTPDDLLRVGFVIHNNTYVLKSAVYNYTNKPKTPAIYLVVAIGLNDNPIMIHSIVDDGGTTYPPFYNKSQRENNLVYEEVINNYNKIMDDLVNKKILKIGRRRHD